MKVFNTYIKLYATLYITAESEDEAAAKLKKFAEENPSLEFSARPQTINESLVMTGESFSRNLPEVSLSPYMTLGNVSESLDVAEELGA